MSVVILIKSHIINVPLLSHGGIQSGALLRGGRRVFFAGREGVNAENG